MRLVNWSVKQSHSKLTLDKEFIHTLCGMKCTFYEVKTRNQCSECENLNAGEPVVCVNNLLECGNNGWKFVKERSLIPFHQGEENNVVLMFKYAPPKTSELLDGPKPKPNSEISDNKESSMPEEFCPEYSLTTTYRKRINSRSAESSPILDDCSLTSHFQNNEIVLFDKKDDGSWCVYSVYSRISLKEKESHSSQKFPNESSTSIKTYKSEESLCSVLYKTSGVSPSALKQFNEKYDIQSLKKKYSISNYNRGKWVISVKENNSHSYWKEICKMISSGELIHCNAKYQRVRKEIWIYCDFINSFDIRKMLIHKMNIIQVLPYNIHPHGVIMTI